MHQSCWHLWTNSDMLVLIQLNWCRKCDFKTFKTQSCPRNVHVFVVLWSFISSNLQLLNNSRMFYLLAKTDPPEFNKYILTQSENESLFICFYYFHHMDFSRGFSVVTVMFICIVPSIKSSKCFGSCGLRMVEKLTQRSMSEQFTKVYTLHAFKSISTS